MSGEGETEGMEKPETIMKLEHVKKAYKGNVLFTDLNLQVQRGESCAIIAGILRKVTKEELEETMRLVGLDPASKVKVGKYSLGMKQRLAIAQALMEKPSLLILDEPFNAIDQKTVEDFRQLLGRLNTQEGVTILMTSHHQDDIQGLCRNIYQIVSKGLKKTEV